MFRRGLALVNPIFLHMKFRSSFFRLILIVALGVVVATLFVGLWSSCDHSVSESVDNHHDVSTGKSLICVPTNKYQTNWLIVRRPT